MSADGQALDWRGAEAYSPLFEADRSIFAWEWLRRDPRYREAADRALTSGSQHAAEAWGLHAFELPHLSAPMARPVWRRDIHGPVLTVLASGTGKGKDTFDLARFEALVTLVGAKGAGEHLLLSDGLRTIRLDVAAGSLASGPVLLQYVLAGIGAAQRPLLTLRRLLALAQSGRFSPFLHRREAKARRWILMLRARDALAAGANQREIAAALLNSAAADPRWRTDASTIRSQAQRLVRGALRMATNGYQDLLE